MLRFHRWMPRHFLSKNANRLKRFIQTRAQCSFLRLRLSLFAQRSCPLSGWLGLHDDWQSGLPARREFFPALLRNLHGLHDVKDEIDAVGDDDRRFVGIDKGPEHTERIVCDGPELHGLHRQEEVTHIGQKAFDRG